MDSEQRSFRRNAASDGIVRVEGNPNISDPLQNALAGSGFRLRRNAADHKHAPKSPMIDGRVADCAGSCTDDATEHDWACSVLGLAKT